jgi:hypothetical protein
MGHDCGAGDLGWIQFDEGDQPDSEQHPLGPRAVMPTPPISLSAAGAMSTGRDNPAMVSSSQGRQPIVPGHIPKYVLHDLARRGEG